MIQEKQQYPTLNCTKVPKAKTTSFKLYEERESSQMPSETNQENDLAKQQHSFKNLSVNQNFSYLGVSKNDLGKQKSFQNIMNETKKILALKSKMEDEQKKRQESKRTLKFKKESQKGKKQAKQFKKQVKLQKKKTQQQDIMLSSLDIQRFSTEAASTKRLIDKLNWLQNLASKCNIISPLLFQIEQQSALDNNKGQTGNGKELLVVHNNEEMMTKLCGMELEIQLMKKNITQDRRLLNAFEIAQLARLEVQQKINNKLSNLSESFDFLHKYSDRQNLSLYAEQLQIELEHMERTEFHEFNEQL